MRGKDEQQLDVFGLVDCSHPDGSPYIDNFHLWDSSRGKRWPAGRAYPHARSRECCAPAVEFAAADRVRCCGPAHSSDWRIWRDGLLHSTTHARTWCPHSTWRPSLGSSQHGNPPGDYAHPGRRGHRYWSRALVDALSCQLSLRCEAFRSDIVHGSAAGVICGFFFSIWGAAIRATRVDPSIALRIDELGSAVCLS